MNEHFTFSGMMLLFSPGQLSNDGGVAPVTGKFVIIAVADGIASRFHFVAGPVEEYRFHAQLVMTFCKQSGIPATWKTPDEFTHVDPSFAQVLGGGWMDVFRGSRRVKLYGSSKAYGTYDTALVERLDFSGTILDGFTYKAV